MDDAAAVPKTDSAVTMPTLGEKVGRYRWVICGLLFFATTVNYVDRQVLGILAKDLKTAIGWTEVDYGNIVAAFNAAYAFGLLLAGRLMDRESDMSWRSCGGVWLLWPTHSRVRPLVSVLLGQRWVSEKRETFPRQSRLSLNGFQKRSVRSRRASSTPVRTSARLLLH